jgi:four helix bundle protein
VSVTNTRNSATAESATAKSATAKSATANSATANSATANSATANGRTFKSDERDEIDDDDSERRCKYARMHPARGLRAWEAASLLADEVRTAVARFPKGNRYGVVDQLVRAAGSIGANIAEGSARRSKSDRLNFYGMARSSASETLHHLKDCRDADLLDRKTYWQLENRTAITHMLVAALIRQQGG